MESASLLLLCDAGSAVAVGRATHTRCDAVPSPNMYRQLICAVPAAVIAAQPRGSALHVVLTGRMEGDAPNEPPVFHHLGLLVPDWSATQGLVAAGVLEGMDVARNVHLRAPAGGSDPRQLPRLLRAALRLDVRDDARNSSLVLEVPPGHGVLPSGSRVAVCSVTAQRGEVALAARLACEVDVLQAAVAACLPPDVVMSSAVGGDTALRDARSLADAILLELRCDDTERLLQVQASTDAAIARVVQARCRS
jgi:hypothetical protein